jgi:thiol:disulfide interchange protein DsbD
MKPRTRLFVAIAAALAAAFLPALLSDTSLDLSQTKLGFTALPLFVVAGFVTALTPCVYPLIPITVSIFGAGSASRSRGHAASLSATYVLGIAAMYSSLGLLSAASGHAFGSYLSSPYVGITFGIIMLVMASSMFGAFELALPSSLQSKLAGVGGFGFGSAFLMGLVCGIVAAPCTGPALLATLTYVAKTGDMWLGFWLLFAYAIGLGAPFFVLGTFTVRLPRSGAWMEAVKSVLGIMLVIVAISFVRPYLPHSPSVPLSSVLVAAVAALVIFFAIIGRTLDLSFHGDTREIAMKALGVAALVAALAFRLGWIVEPRLPGGIVKCADASELPPDCKAAKVAPEIAWLTDEVAALAQSKATGKPMLVDFGAQWCSACMELEHRTYTDPEVRAHVSKYFVPFKVDATDDTETVLALEKKYGVLGLPLVTVVDKDGHQLDSPKISGFMKPEQFLAELAKAKIQ